MLIDVVVFLPLVAALALLLIPRHALAPLKGVALAGTTLTFLAGLVFVAGPAHETSQFVPWVSGRLSAAYHVRVDALSVFFVLLTTFVSVPAVWAAFSYADARRVRGYLFLLLAFETTLLGLFTAGNLLLFYVYWDLMLIPVFLLLVAYTDSPAARRAAWGYLIYNGAGGLVLLLGVVGVAWQAHTFEVLGRPLHGLPGTLETWLFVAFALAFLIKTPAFPFHAWMPATYTEAPSPVVAMVSGIQSKAGLYGFMVFALPLFGHAAREWAPVLLVIAVASVIYGALTALGQRDIKTLVAFSSLSHLGLVVLALFAFDAISIPASIVMIVAHGLISAALFLLLGFVEERVGSRDLATLGGLAYNAPRLAAYMLIASMGALGLPGLAGFSGEFLILLGAWQTQPVYTAIALVAVVLASVYVLKLFQGMMHGAPMDNAANGVVELRARELALVAPLLAAIIVVGVWPAWINDRAPSAQVGAYPPASADTEPFGRALQMTAQFEVRK